MIETQRTWIAGTYQMLWDCESCGSTRLLGVDHRHCPNCGHPQQPQARYFPHKSERVPTVYRGHQPDWACQYCSTPNAAQFCRSCGAPRGDSPTVATLPSEPVAGSEREGRGIEGARRAEAPKEGDRPATAVGAFAGAFIDDVRAAEPRLSKRERKARRRALRQNTGAAPREPKPKPKRTRRPRGLPRNVRQAAQRALAFLRRPSWARFFTIGGGLLAAMFTAWLVLTWSRPVDMELVTRTWTRTTALQVWRAVPREGWCGSMSGGAYRVSRSTRIHHYNKIPDGEDCHVEAGSCAQSCSQVDHGNGSFSEVCSQSCSSDRTVCTTRYRQEPVYADYCHYTVDEWVTRREQTAEGVWPQPPEWPEIAARTCDGAPRHGCEQSVHAEQRYDLHLRAVGVGRAGVSTVCAVAEGAWTHAREGSIWRLKRRVVSGWIDCESLALLRPARAM